jgi:hypothetical protein
VKKLVNGELLDMSPAEEAAWTATLPGLAERRFARIEAMKAERDRRRLANGYQVGANWYHSDPDSRTQQLGLVMLGASIPAGLQWRTMGGSYVTMTQTLAQQILGAAATSDSAIHAHGEALRTTIAGSTSPETVDVLAGWPAGFGE